MSGFVVKKLDTIKIWIHDQGCHLAFNSSNGYNKNYLLIASYGQVKI